MSHCLARIAAGNYGYTHDESEDIDISHLYSGEHKRKRVGENKRSALP